MFNSNNKRNHTPSVRRAKTNFYQRHLKVRQAYHSYQRNQPDIEPTPIGEIHLKGHWLIEAGFKINNPIKVRIMPGCLVVTIDHQPNQLFSQFNQLKANEQQLIKDLLGQFLRE